MGFRDGVGMREGRELGLELEGNGKENERDWGLVRDFKELGRKA